MTRLAGKSGVPLTVTGHPGTLRLVFDHPDALALETLLTVRMLDHGILAGASFYPCWKHTLQHVNAYLHAAEAVYAELGEAIAKRDIASRIGGPVRQTGFARLT